MNFLIYSFLICLLTISAYADLRCTGDGTTSDPCGSCVPKCIGGHFVEFEYRNCTEACVCPKGSILNQDNNSCMHLDECKGVPKCLPNMEYRPCGSHCLDRCELASLSQLCMPCCKPGCFCKRGFYLNNNNVCVQNC